jgi:uncharacterized protein YuzE
MHYETDVPLTCTNDTDADAAYIYFQHPIARGQAVHTATVDTGTLRCMINLDFDADGRLLGLEVIGAGSHLPAPLLAAIRSAD